MHSDYLNEDKICQMFNDEQDICPKRQQESLNFTVTSRQSRYNPAAQAQHHKPYITIEASHNLPPYSPYTMHPQTPSPPMPNPNDTISLALSQINKFNNWLTTSSKNTQKIIDDFSTLASSTDIDRCVGLDMIDFGGLRKRWGRNSGDCGECVRKQELIQYIQVQYNTQINQCREYKEKVQKYQRQLNDQVMTGLRTNLLDSVQVALLRQQCQSLHSQLLTLRLQSQKSKLQKSSSTLMQKSTSFLKTKDILEKPTNSKLFSNGKYLNLNLNPNDTMSMNRVDSIICFGDTEPNLEELIRFYGDEAEGMRGRRGGARGKAVNQRNQSKLYELYKNIISNFQSLKLFKQKCPCLFLPDTPKPPKPQTTQPIQPYPMLHPSPSASMPTQSSSSSDQHLHKIISSQQMQIKSLQNENNNLDQTRNELLNQLTFTTHKLKQYEGRIKRLEDEVRREVVEKRRLMGLVEELRGAVRVFCRVRPRVGVELKHKIGLVYGDDNRVIKDGKEYQFDYVFSDKTSQKQIFNQTKNLVQLCYQGKNLCILSYGQSGSGKTYTIHGDDHNPGLAINIINYLYELIQKDTKNNTILSLSFLEIYKDEIRDLMGISGSGKIEVQREREDCQGLSLGELKAIRVRTKEQLLEVYGKGIFNRYNRQNEINVDNSRSHCVLTINIERNSRKYRQNQKSHTKISKIALVDLAGTQRTPQSNPLVTKQLQSITKSFMCLNSLLSSLKYKTQSISPKQSKLTYILKQFLTPKCNIVTFINISSSELNGSETTNSLAFGARIRGPEGLGAGRVKEKDREREKENKERDIREVKETKQLRDGEKNRRSSARLSVS